MSIDPKEEFLLDLRTTCTRDEAAAKLLGWMRGAVRRKLVRVTDSGIAPDELPTFYSLDDSLPQHLAELRSAARSALLGAAESDNADQLLDEKHAALDEIDALIAKAHRILADIDDELAKGEASALRIDPATTEQSGEASITPASLDRWAREKYGLSVLDAEDAVPADTPVSQASAADAPKTVLAAPAAKPVARRTAFENLLTTFAFALDALVEKSGPLFKHNDGSLNVQALANDLSDRAAAANRGKVLSGQSAEAIKDRIEAAAREEAKANGGEAMSGQSAADIEDRIEAAERAKRSRLPAK